MDRLISLHAAIDALVTPRVHDVYDSYWNGRNKQYQEDINAINALPSAQPDLSEYSDKLWRAAYERGKKDAQADIIRCKDCKKREHCRTTNTWAVAPSDNWFCADGERREDG